MADYLWREAALSQASYNFGFISQTHLLARMAALRLMCAPDDPTKAFAKHILQMEEWTDQDEWIVSENRPDEQQRDKSERRESVVEGGDYDFDAILRFMPASSTGLSHWIFHRSDPDPFPSVPHGHYKGQKQPKLDAYLGYIYNGAAQTGRESRKKIISLWNDPKFRAFASQAAGRLPPSLRRQK